LFRKDKTSSNCGWRWLPDMEDNCERMEWAFQRFGDFKIVGQVIHTAKYADNLVLLTKEEAVLQDMID
jgi:hypothetical protein